MYDVYLASPFFTDEQIERRDRVREFLMNRGYTVFSPQHDNPVWDNNAVTAEVIYYNNLSAIKTSSFIVAITNDKDMGTLWECGYATALGKMIVYLWENKAPVTVNVMLAFSGKIVNRVKDVVSAMYAFDVDNSHITNFE